MTKFNNSKDGKKRATIKVDFRIDADNIALALIYNSGGSNILSLANKMSKVKMIKILKSTIQYDSARVFGCGAYDDIVDNQGDLGDFDKLVDIVKTKFGVDN